MRILILVWKIQIHTVQAACRETVSPYAGLAIPLSFFHWLQLFQGLPENHLLHLSNEKMHSHWRLHTSTLLLPQQCSHCCRSNGRASVSQKSAWRHLSLLCSLPLSSLPSSISSAWWISWVPKAGIFFKAESVLCPPCELTTFLAIVFV